MRQWLLEGAPSKPPSFVRTTILEAFCPLSTFSEGGCVLLRRKTNNPSIPHMTFGLFLGEFSYQIAIRSPSQSDDNALTFVPLAYLMPASEAAQTMITSRQYDTHEKRKGDTVDVTLFVPDGLPPLPAEFTINK